MFPYVFVDTTDAWFESRRRRMMISLAGPASDVVLGGAFALACLVTAPGGVRDVLFQVAFGGYVGALFNLNPLMERDGYHVLVDLLARARSAPARHPRTCTRSCPGAVRADSAAAARLRDRLAGVVGAHRGLRRRAVAALLPRSWPSWPRRPWCGRCCRPSTSCSRSPSPSSSCGRSGRACIGRARRWLPARVSRGSLGREPLRAARGAGMASVDQTTPAETNGAAAPHDRSREPGHRASSSPPCRCSAPRSSRRWPQRARQAQPQWEAIGFDGRARIMRRAQKWMLDNADRVLESVVRESGKTYEDAQLADLGYTVTALGFWAKEAAKYLADERVPVVEQPGGRRQEAGHPLRAGRRRRGDRALELPDRQLLR